MRCWVPAALSVAMAFIAAPLSADVLVNPWRVASEINWPFGEYRLCLGYTGKWKASRVMHEYARAKLESLGQGRDKQFVSSNWSDAILNEQILHAVEHSIAQCRLRAAGERFDETCPLGRLSIEEAGELVGADRDEFWTQPSRHLKPLKAEQQAKLDALKGEVEEVCGF